MIHRRDEDAKNWCGTFEAAELTRHLKDADFQVFWKWMTEQNKDDPDNFKFWEPLWKAFCQGAKYEMETHSYERFLKTLNLEEKTDAETRRVDQPGIVHEQGKR